MKKRRLILIMIGLFAAVVLTIFVWPGGREPEYQGKKLSEWLGQYNSLAENLNRIENGKRCEEAVRHIGTKGIPWLLKWIHCDPSPVKNKIAGLMLRVPNAKIKSFGMNLLRSNLHPGRSHEALAGFQLLGSAANPAIPELCRLAEDARSRFTAQAAFSALVGIGPDALPFLVRGLSDERATIRMKAARIVCEHAWWTNAIIAVPGLIECLTNKNETLIEISALTLGKLKLAPELVVPALTNCLGQPRLHSPMVVLNSLSQFGESARSAVPAILPLLDPDNSVLREAAVNALNRIAPEMLTTNLVPQDAKP